MQNDLIPLEREPRAAVPTETAARHLNKQPQTMRKWACREDGPIRPLRIPGSKGLLWRTSDLRRLLGIECTTTA